MNETLLLVATAELEKQLQTVALQLAMAVVRLREADAQLAAAGLPTAQPDLFANAGNDVAQVLAISRDVAIRARRSSAISVALRGPSGAA